MAYGDSLDPTLCDTCEEAPHTTSRTEGGSLPKLLLCQPCAEDFDRMTKLSVGKLTPMQRAALNA